MEYRMNSNGEYDYEWQDIVTPAPAPQDDFTPRAVDELTETMDNLDLPPTTENSYGYEGHDAEHNDSGYATADLDDFDDPVVQEAMSNRNEMYGTSGHGGPSTEPAYGTAYEEDDGAATPKGRQSPTPSFDITGTHGSAEDLDPRYVVEPSHKFRPGSVFKVLWSEPSGSHAAGNSTISEKQQIQDQFGGSVFIGFRRFIVIANDEGHCTCVPILTYQGKACNKRGVKAHKHGMIYSHKLHRPLRDEPKLGFPPVRAKITIEGEKLAKESRVNYSKLVTVEHNVKVFFIGYISPDDFEDVEYAVDDCWEKKTRAKKKSRK
ncbi:uncharacterized protein N0V96_010135 [Colletotrichum fioriniae]|uniref:uncharacterized protein n=1 Tax=Colletotrichum fioriniae TaxID=710243 RepID=UPI0032DB68A8|nr:hypothetical protein N0V96_010135 [Colletotrichum fioriniae]